MGVGIHLSAFLFIKILINSIDNLNPLNYKLHLFSFMKSKILLLKAIFLQLSYFQQ